jgi:ElaA protein
VPVAFHHAHVRAIDPLTLYAILRLRVEVFVVEQSCPYPELDGRDLEPGAELFWATDGPDVLATLRVLHDADGALRVGPSRNGLRGSVARRGVEADAGGP